VIQNRIRNQKGSLIKGPPAVAWMAIIGYIFICLAALAIGAGKLLNLIVPAGAVALGLLFYLRYPIFYVNFALWLFVLTPLLRRVADFQSSFTSPSPILLTPPLVTGISIITLYKNLPKMNRQGAFPYILVFTALAYAFLLGIVLGDPQKVIKSGFQWICPVLFSFHLFSQWRDYPLYRAAIERFYLWGVMVTGVYGILQYLLAPQWDRFWLIQSQLVSAGKPEPLGIRVWSTMDGPFAFAMFILPGLLLLLSYRGALSTPASIAGYIALLLSRVRTSWIALVISVTMMLFSLKSSLQIRLIAIVTVMVVLVIPLTNIPQFAAVIDSRLESLFSIQDDGSGVERAETYSLLIWQALSCWFGYGIGNRPDFGRPIDSAVLSMLFSYGWFGTILYLGGVLLILYQLFKCPEIRSDPFISMARSFVISILIVMPLGNALQDTPGTAFWMFLGMGLAGRKYYVYKRLKKNFDRQANGNSLNSNLSPH